MLYGYPIMTLKVKDHKTLNTNTQLQTLLTTSTKERFTTLATYKNVKFNKVRVTLPLFCCLSKLCFSHFTETIKLQAGIKRSQYSNAIHVRKQVLTLTKASSTQLQQMCSVFQSSFSNDVIQVSKSQQQRSLCTAIVSCSNFFTFILTSRVIQCFKYLAYCNFFRDFAVLISSTRAETLLSVRQLLIRLNGREKSKHYFSFNSIANKMYQHTTPRYYGICT